MSRSIVGCKTPTCDYISIFVSQVGLSGFTLEPRVDQIVTTTIALADSIKMMQICRHNWEVKKPSAVHMIFGHTYLNLI